MTGVIIGLLILVILLLVVLILRKQEVKYPLHDTLPDKLAETERRLNERLEAFRAAHEQTQATQRQELNATLIQNADRVTKLVSETLPLTVQTRFNAILTQVQPLLQNIESQMAQVNQMRVGVQDLSGSVAAFSKMLGNVKSRGTWAEWQLRDILSNMLTTEQFGENIHPNPRTPKRVVEFAIALPGKEGDTLWLPIDSKFPNDAYEKLLIASESGDKKATDEALKALGARVKKFALEIRDLYIQPPHTTNFAILYLPTEGLYQEILQQPEIISVIQNEYKVLVAGPTTLMALINALQMGFQTLAVQKNTAQLIDTLQKVKKAVNQFSEQQIKTKNALESALAALEEEQRKVQALARALRNITTNDDEAPHEEEEENA